MTGTTNMTGNDHCVHKMIISFDIYQLVCLYVLYRLMNNKKINRMVLNIENLANLIYCIYFTCSFGSDMIHKLSKFYYPKHKSHVHLISDSDSDSESETDSESLHLDDDDVFDIDLNQVLNENEMDKELSVLTGAVDFNEFQFKNVLEPVPEEIQTEKEKEKETIEDSNSRSSSEGFVKLG